MRRNHQSRAERLLIASLMVLLTGCAGDATSGTHETLATGAGTYDLAATFQTFTAPDPAANCLINNCPHKSATIPPGSSLSGALTLGAPTQSGGRLVYPVPSSVINEVDCRGGTSCFSRSVEYGSSSMSFFADALQETAGFGASGENVYIRTASMAGDSLAGSLDWYVFNGVAYQYYSGTFVAHRRP